MTKKYNFILHLACFCMLIMAGCEPISPVDREQYSTHAAVTLGQVSIDSASPTPSPRPSDGKCKNCKGVGKVGDGRTMLTCEVCKGTGKDTTATEESSLPSPIGRGAGGEGDLSETILAAMDKNISDKDCGTVICVGDQCELPQKIDMQSDPEANVKPTLAIVTPTITVYSSPTCEPCKKWIRNEAPKWNAQGWTIQVEEYSGPERVPWFQISDREIDLTHRGWMTPDSFIKLKNSQRQ
jgi:hypothetical protein